MRCSSFFVFVFGWFGGLGFPFVVLKVTLLARDLRIAQASWQSCPFSVEVLQSPPPHLSLKSVVV